MVRILVERVLPYNPENTRKKYVEIAGKSTDTKPTSEEWVTGSVFIEVNTGKAYFYEEEADTWNAAGGGSNG